MAVVRKKQDDKVLKTLRELVAIGGNKECFDCGQKGPTYINMTIGSFVCTTCSGILRGLTPPHRVKSISMATFTQEEIDFVRQNGNDTCSTTWLGLWDPKRAIKQEHRDFMIDKYERKRYYLEPASPLKSLPSNTTSSTTSLSANNGISNSSSNLSSRNGAENPVPLKTITLTPPTSLRLSRTNSNSSSGLNGNSSQASSVTSSSTNLKFQQQFTPDDSNFFSEPPKILPPTPQKHSSHHHQRLNGTVNGSAFERSQKNGLLTNASNGNANSINNNPNANKFTPDSDFVADFSNANIVSVNGATTDSNGLKNSGNHKLSNGFPENEIPSNGHQNGGINNRQTNGEMENFADFEHNTIYNAAGNISSGSFFSNSNSIDSSTTNSSSSTTSVNSINNDVFINNYSLLNNNNSANATATDSNGVGVGGTDLSNFNSNQFTAFSDYPTNAANFNGGSSLCNGPATQGTNGYNYFQNYQPGTDSSGSSSLNFTTNANNNSNNNNNITNVQWNLWQQFNQWPPHEPQPMFGSMSSLSCNSQSQQSSASLIRSHQHKQQQQQQQQHQQNQQHHSSYQNRWSLPISGSAKSAAAYSSATPSVDRYAALKDLDDQFREIKFENETNNNNNGTTNGMSNGLMNGNHTNDVHQVSSANPFKTANPFQQQQQPSQTLSWTIPGSTPPTTGATTNGFYGTSPYQNGFAHPHHLLNGNVTNGAGFTNAFHHHSGMNNAASVVPQFNGTAATGPMNHFGHFGNPFMAGGATTATSKSNNPFL